MTISTKQEANLILNQLTQTETGSTVLMAMVGAQHFSFDSTKAANVSFRFKCCKAANHVCIQLNIMDCYDVTFTKIRGIDAKTVKVFENAYFDDLRDIFEDFTGLLLHF